MDQITLPHSEIFVDRIRADAARAQAKIRRYAEPGEVTASDDLWEEAIAVLSSAYDDAPDSVAQDIMAADAFPSISDGYDGTINILWRRGPRQVLMTLLGDDQHLVTWSGLDVDAPSDVIQGEFKTDKANPLMLMWLTR
jgi:hypothetical protein